MPVYYNEFDPKAAAWLRELMASGLIPQGHVDERSIVDVRGSDLAGYVQCHFFAGIGGWPHALNLAGWGDRPIWTGSCPCQPFSQAGKGEGEQDSRHLWPHLLRLIEERRPPTVFGEQVASKAGRRWLNGVRTDLEALDYEVGAADLCAASVGAPHIRQRLFWVSDATRGGRGIVGDAAALTRDSGHADSSCFIRRVGDTDIARSQGRRIDAGEYTNQCASGAPGEFGGMEHTEGIGRRGRADDSDGGRRELSFRPSGETRGMAESNGWQSSGGIVQRSGQHGQQPEDRGTRRMGNADSSGCETLRGFGLGEETRSAQFTNSGARGGAWSDFDILHCTDGKARRVEAGTFPLAHGIPARMGRLRGYGNAIVPELAAEFIKAYLETQAKGEGH